MLLEVQGLKTYFDTRKGPVKAVDGISYDIAPEEIVALVGESGCGKTVSTLSLLRPIPDPKLERHRERLVLKGEIPSPINPPPGCTFHPRCSECMEICSQEVPALLDKGGRWVACHRAS